MQRKKTFNAFGALKTTLISVLMSFCVIAALSLRHSPRVAQ